MTYAKLSQKKYTEHADDWTPESICAKDVAPQVAVALEPQVLVSDKNWAELSFALERQWRYPEPQIATNEVGCDCENVCEHA